MKTLSLKDFFNYINYDWKKDEEHLKTVCYYTKTRVNPKMGNMELTAGTEQTFLLKAIAEWVKATSFFEIGTGRGTACYALSLLPNIKEIHTIDILGYHQKFSTAIGYKPANVSLSDIKNMIPFKEKSKIYFHHRKELERLQAEHKNKFDLCFIDGEHTNKKVILEDYAACLNVAKSDAFIIWDDYDPEQFSVKSIVDELLEKNPDLNAILIEQRGHLFLDKPAEKNRGIVIMRKGKIL